MTPATIAILCNPFAGAGRSSGIASKLADHLKQHQIPYFLFNEKWPDDLISFTEAWIVGGDGTIHYFVNKFPDISIPLVFFGGGTGNDLHLLLYGKISTEQQLEKMEQAATRKIDLATCNEKYFINCIGIGFEGAVARDMVGKIKRPGKTSYLIAILKRLFFYSSRRYQTSSDELKTNRHYMIINVANGQSTGGGFHIAPAAAIDDGLLDVVLVNKLHPLLRLRYLPVIEKGKHLGLPIVRHYKTQKILIESEHEMLAHLDGEIYTSNKFTIGILPGQLSIRY